jgi:hypothetical protein
MKSKGLVGTRSVHSNLASLGCICKASTMLIILLTIKIPLGVKCKCPQRVIVCPSKKLYNTSGTVAPSKYVSHSVRTWENLSLIEVRNDISKQPKGKAMEYIWHPTLAHKKMGGSGPVDGIETVCSTSLLNRVTKLGNASERSWLWGMRLRKSRFTYSSCGVQMFSPF